MTPLPDGVIPALSLPLPLLAAASAEAALSFIGVPAVRDGLSVHLPTVTMDVTVQRSAFPARHDGAGRRVRVDDARPGGERALVAGAAIALALAANVVGVIGTGLLADLYGPEAATGFFHVAYGKVVYLLALVPFVLLVAGLRRSRPPGLPAPASTGGALSVSVLIPTKNRPRFSPTP